MLRAAVLLIAATGASSLDFKPSCYGWPDINRDWSNTAGNALPRLLHNSAPKFSLKTLDQSSTVSLHELLATGPVVLQFADYSCPKFQANIASTNALAKAFGSKLHVVYAYVTEVHPLSPEVMPYAGQVMESPCSIHQAFNYSARLANAQLVNSKLCHTSEGFSSAVTVLIDDLTPHNATGNNPVWCTYGQGPNMGFVIAQNGTVVAELDWFSGSLQGDTEAGGAALTEVFTAVNSILGTSECFDKCSIKGNAADCSQQSCEQLVKKYSCQDYYAPGKPYAGWCDKQCGYGTCAASQE